MGVEDAAEIRQLLGYKDGTAGGMMTTQFVAVHEDTTVGETIEVLRELPEDHPTVHYVYVLNEYERLVGVLSLRTLVLTDDAKPVGSVMFEDIITATPDETEEDVAADIFKYDLPASPWWTSAAGFGHRDHRRRMGRHRGGRERRQGARERAPWWRA